MNRYGRTAMRHPVNVTPSHLTDLPEPNGYIEGTKAEVTDLALTLAGPDPAEETYLQKAARLSTARMQAEEILMANLVWGPSPELTLAEARDEWEQTSPSEENLIAWAERVQDHPDSMPSTDELGEMAERWALPVRFLEDLIATEPPRDFTRHHVSALREAATIRFLREVR